jgi:hypothetical protein
VRAVEKRLRERIKDLEAKLSTVEADRQGFRDAITRNIREAIRIHGEGKYWNMASLIETLAKQIAQRERWYW